MHKLTFTTTRQLVSDEADPKRACKG